MKQGQRITVLGDGGWGTAISKVLADKGAQVVMWGHDPDYLARMKSTRENRLFLPGIRIPENMAFEPDLAKALDRADLALMVIPTKFMRRVLTGISFPANLGVVSLTKGIEQETLLRPSQILTELTGCRRIAVLSGPSHAEEVAQGLPTTVTVASTDTSLATVVQETLMTPSFRVYTSDDPIGVELGGALKNVIALAAGICIGLGLGDNSLAALITRGLAEITRLGTALGAKSSTFAGLSGLGDLVVTCVSQHGRNRAVGLELARGKKLSGIVAGHQTVAEGVTTAASAMALADRAGVGMPIVSEVEQVLYHDKDPRKAVSDLMARQGKAEGA